MLIRDMLSACRVELLSPRPQKPGNQLLLQLLSANVQSALNEANNTGRAWAVADSILTVSQGRGEYILNAANVGRILDVNTYDPTNASWVERQIPFFDLNQITEHHNLPRDIMPWTVDGGPHTAMRMSFFRKEGLDTVYVKILPIPQLTASYRISYSIQKFGGPDTSLDVEPILSNHHAMLIVQTCRDALPGSEWFDDEDKNDGRRSSLVASYRARLDMLIPQFKIGVSSLTMPRSTQRYFPTSID